MELDLDVRGTRIAAGVSGDGPGTVVWSHGLLSDRATDDAVGLVDWSAPPRGRRLVRYDARGHGRSRPARSPDELTWHALGADMVGVADAVGAERFAVGGVSMGCAAALHAAVAAPHRVEALVLAAAPTAWAGRAAQAERYATAVALLRERPHRALGLLAATVHAAGPFGTIVAAGHPHASEVMRRHLCELDPAAVAVVLEGAARSDLPAPAEVAALDAPALLLTWDGDPGHPRSTAERLHALLPSSELHVARSLDEVRRWREHIRRFLAEVGTAA